MKVSSVALAAVLSLAGVPHTVFGADFNYDNQNAWPSVDTGSSDNECGRANASGEGQSPIDIPMTQCGTGTTGYMFYHGDCTADDLKYTMNNHGVKAEYVGGCTPPSMKIPGHNSMFDVLQFHIHTGCEHKMAGEGCDAELHIVHVERTAATSKELAVVGIFMNGADEKSAGFDTLLDKWGEVSCTSYACPASTRDLEVKRALQDTFSPYSLIPEDSEFIKYFGGLTTPPCTEIVNWNVVATPLKISYMQLASLATAIIEYEGYRNDSDQCVTEETVADIVGYTSRETQEILGRTIEKVCADSTMMDAEPAAPTPTTPTTPTAPSPTPPSPSPPTGGAPSPAPPTGGTDPSTRSADGSAAAIATAGAMALSAVTAIGAALN